MRMLLFNHNWSASLFLTPWLLFTAANRLPGGPLIVSYVTNDGLTVDKVVNEAVAGANVLIWHKGQLVKNDTTGQVANRLPDGPLIVAYVTNDGLTVDKVVNEAAAGVNVLIWFSAQLVKNDTTNQPEVRFDWSHNISFIAQVQQELKQMELPTVHIIGVGGWNAPHPDTSFTGNQWFQAWTSWDSDLQKEVPGFEGFDGIDWDLEGNDDGKYQTFTQESLDLVGQMSQQLKLHGYIVSLVPPQSYFDFQTSEFSTSVYFPPGDPWHPDFTYTGRNVYAYWLAKYGTSQVREKGHESRPESVPTFDFIDVQFYESYSRSDYALDVQNMTFADYFVNVYLHNVSQNSWEVNFSENSTLADQVINIPIAVQLVVGFAVTKLNSKVTYVSPEQIAEAWNVLESSGMATPRGLMFWNMKLEPDNTSDPANMANAFNKILKTRTISKSFHPKCI